MLVENAKDLSNIDSTLYVQHNIYQDSLLLKNKNNNQSLLINTLQLNTSIDGTAPIKLKNVKNTCPIYFYYYSYNGQCIIIFSTEKYYQ